MHTIYTEQEEIDIVARALSKINFLDGWVVGQFDCGSLIHWNVHSQRRILGTWPDSSTN